MTQVALALLLSCGSTTPCPPPTPLPPLRPPVHWADPAGGSLMPGAGPAAGDTTATTGALVPGEDRVRHLGHAFAATAMAYGGLRSVLDPADGRLAAASLALGLGLGKELADARAGGHFDLVDLAWDAAGVVVGYLFVQRIR